MKVHRRTPQSYHRKKPYRKPRKLMLIVTEGAKTEPNYFGDLKKAWRLGTTDIEIIAQGADPSAIVERAIKEQKRRDKESRYDQVWCVWDHDNHECLKKATDKAQDHGFKIALSVPCFEIWYLLHFLYTAQPFESPHDVVRSLKQHISDYDKGKHYFEQIEPKTRDAITNAQRLRKNNADTDSHSSHSPATDVDQLVSELMRLREGNTSI